MNKPIPGNLAMRL